jgi:tRNA dimethylallyltransferase
MGRIKTKSKATLISVVGPTAVGKTRLAIEIAKAFDTVIISSDSRQFFRELNIGTAKPSPEELNQVEHYFINSLSIQDEYSVGKFEKDAITLLKKLFNQYSVVVMVGGSGLYCQAIWEGIDEMPKIDPAIRAELNDSYQKLGIKPLQIELQKSDPDYYLEVDQKNHVRLIRALEVIRSTGLKFSELRSKQHILSSRPFNMVNIGLEMERKLLYDRIDQRMDDMIENGLFEEAESFYENRYLNALRTVGYQEIFGYLSQEYDRDEAIRLLKRNSRRYAKRQLTWFKKNPSIQWFIKNESDDLIREVFGWIHSRIN